jgi:hypothetical protein
LKYHRGMCPTPHTGRRGEDEALDDPLGHDKARKGGSPIQLSLVKLDSAHLDATVNVDRIESGVERDRECGAELVVFPELATTGYLEPIMPGEAYSRGVAGADKWRDLLIKFRVLAETIPESTTHRLAGLARRLDIGIVFGMLDAHPTLRRAAANTVVAVGPGGVAGLQRKLQMPRNEKHVFTPRNEFIEINVCYDAHFSEQTRASAPRARNLSSRASPDRPRGDSQGHIFSDRAACLPFAHARHAERIVLRLNEPGRPPERLLLHG